MKTARISLYNRCVMSKLCLGYFDDQTQKLLTEDSADIGARTKKQPCVVCGQLCMPIFDRQEWMPKFHS